MGKVILIIIALFIIPLSLISASIGEQLPQACGGDSELIIACLGDEELTFLGGEAEFVSSWFTNVRVDEEVEEVVVVPIPKEEILEKGFFEKPLGIFLVLGLFVFMIIFIYRKGKKEGEEERRREIEKRNI